MNNRTTEQQNNRTTNVEFVKLKKRFFIVCVILFFSLAANFLVLVKKRDKILEKFASYSDFKIEQIQITTASRTNTLPRKISVLFIGNSLTNHSICSFWWGKWGMAASTKENDYVHKTLALLKQDFEVEFDAKGLWGWEVMSPDRAEALEEIEPLLLKKHYDIIIVQLGENIQNCETLAQDFPYLVEYIAKKQNKNGVLPQIVLVGDFWKNELHQKIKLVTCKSVLDKDGKQIATFVDLSDMWGDKIYQSSMGAKVAGDDGAMHEVNHAGVAGHPGDNGMEEIAKRIYKAIKEN